MTALVIAELSPVTTDSHYGVQLAHQANFSANLCGVFRSFLCSSSYFFPPRCELTRTRKLAFLVITDIVIILLQRTFLMLYCINK